ncbi:hypothetical protein [Cupriavidus metallidurans]|uniref:hypothetical protein n=1 Tax=Cupriavidus metallidurans TaxID=119219 RepID=UPI003CFDD29C
MDEAVCRRLRIGATRCRINQFRWQGLPVFPGTINTLYFSLGYANEIGIEREAHHQFFYTIPVVARFPRSRADYAVFRYEALLYTTPPIDRISDRNQPEITGLNGKVVQVC